MEASKDDELDLTLPYQAPPDEEKGSKENLLNPEKHTPSYSAIEREEKEIPANHFNNGSVDFDRLFDFADVCDIILILLGALASCTVGVCIALIGYFFSDIVDYLIDPWLYNYHDSTSTTNNNNSNMATKTKNMGELESKITSNSHAYIILGCVAFVSSIIQLFCWKVSAARQSHYIRSILFKRIMQNDYEWFSSDKLTTIDNLLFKDIGKLSRGIEINIASGIEWLVVCVASIIIAFKFCWKLAFVELALNVLLLLLIVMTWYVWHKYFSEEDNAYDSAEEVIDQAIRMISTVIAYDGAYKESEKLRNKLFEVDKVSLRKKLIVGLLLAILVSFILSSYTLVFWYASRLIRYHHLSIGKMLATVLLGSVFLPFGASKLADFCRKLKKAKQSAYDIQKIIRSRRKDLDRFLTESPPEIGGTLSFMNVVLTDDANNYVLNDLTFTADYHQSVALVDTNNSLKCIVDLMLKFKQPTSGSITLDGNDLGNLDTKFVRKHIGFVSRKPILFKDMSIEENLCMGNELSSKEEIEAVCGQVDVLDYINDLSNGFNTIVNDKLKITNSLCKRIVLARALLKQPSFLIVEQPGYGLDMKAKRYFYEILDILRKDRTTLVFETGFESIQRYDKIILVSEGKVREEGNHESLMDSEGFYSSFVGESIDEIGHDDESYEPLEMEGIRQNLDGISKDHTWKILKWNQSKCTLLFASIFFSILCGIVQPVFAILLGHLIETYKIKSVNVQAEESLFFSLMFLILAAIAFFSFTFKAYFISKCGTNLITDLRCYFLQSLLNQELKFFDNFNELKTYKTFLRVGIPKVEVISRNRIGRLWQNLAAFSTGMIIGFVYSWQIALTSFAFMLLSIILNGLAYELENSKRKTREECKSQGRRLLEECYWRIGDIKELNAIDWFVEKFKSKFVFHYRLNMVKDTFISLLFALAKSILFFGFVAIFILAAYLMDKDKLTVIDFTKCITSVIIGFFASFECRNFDSAVEQAKNKKSASKFFDVVDRQSEIDSRSNLGFKPEAIYGVISFQDVRFAYPTFPEEEVLNGISFRLSRGQVYALVGDVDKNVCLKLLERFYDPTKGLIAIDDNPIERLNVRWLRAQIGYVDSRAEIFNGTVADNIVYGDNSKLIDMLEVVNAAKKANVHEFVSLLPHGYHTKIGKHGMDLDLDKRQRICIARALLRRPRILLLDNAMKDMDKEMEIVVQAALQEGSRLRTTIMATDRLTSAHNADAIVVIKNGRVVEAGKHSDLIERNGIYYDMYTKEET